MTRLHHPKFSSSSTFLQLEFPSCSPVARANKPCVLADVRGRIQGHQIARRGPTPFRNRFNSVHPGWNDCRPVQLATAHNNELEIGAYPVASDLIEGGAKLDLDFRATKPPLRRIIPPPLSVLKGARTMIITMARPWHGFAPSPR